METPLKVCFPPIADIEHQLQRRHYQSTRGAHVGSLLALPFLPTSVSDMELEAIFTWLLGLEAVACLWLGFAAWREAEGMNVIIRSIGPMLGVFAAAIILYGIWR